MGANELAEALAITPSAVSQHLKILRFAGLVRSERKGYWLPYEVDQSALVQKYEKELKKELEVDRARIRELKQPGQRSLFFSILFKYLLHN
jgi:DNA-binding transcriptional ArsR family regulator